MVISGISMLDHPIARLRIPATASQAAFRITFKSCDAGAPQRSIGAFQRSFLPLPAVHAGHAPVFSGAAMAA